VGATQTQAILEDFKARKAALASGQPAAVHAGRVGHESGSC